VTTCSHDIPNEWQSKRHLWPLTIPIHLDCVVSNQTYVVDRQKPSLNHEKGMLEQ